MTGEERGGGVKAEEEGGDGWEKLAEGGTDDAGPGSTIVGLETLVL